MHSDAFASLLPDFTVGPLVAIQQTLCQKRGESSYYDFGNARLPIFPLAVFFLKPRGKIMAKSEIICSFKDLLQKYRDSAFSLRNQGDKFERLMAAFLKTAPMYSGMFKNVWLWGEFPFRSDFGGQDTGIDLVAQTTGGDYWAVQCKFYDEETQITKPDIDTFLATSSRTFTNEQLQTTSFTTRLFISTTNKWNSNAEEVIHNQQPPVLRLSLYDLENAPVDWDALDKGVFGEAARTEKKTLRAHQKTALESTHKHFQEHDRGKLIMACGTGKTFTSLKIAEHETGGNGLVLFLVPSIALLGQTLREWMAETEHEINPICICSDSTVTKAKSKGNNEDEMTASTVDLAMPASTNVDNIVRQFEMLRMTNKSGMTVVFSTYQSIDVISSAQKAMNKLYPNEYDFDLVICDEAHRTTGVTLKDKEDANFVKVHKDEFIKAKKRLYMTATPRLYNESSKLKAQEHDAELCSMDDETIYGAEMYRIGFGEAVDKQLLSDYKVLVLTLKESQIPMSLQAVINDATNEVNTDDITKLIGCINALSKRMLVDEGLLRASDPEPMHRAVAFCQTIQISKKITDIFNTHKDAYYDSLTAEERKNIVGVVSDHIDGGMGAGERDAKLSWLKNCPTDTNECRILTNVRCLSEGVDVPSLDAVMFLSARNSQVDVVQSVGRVMRRAEGKKYGYIIIPVVIPDGVAPEEALEDNDRFKVVWSVLNALRAHDDRFNAMVNKIELNTKRPNGGGTVLIGPVGGAGSGDGETEVVDGDPTDGTPKQISFPFEQWQDAIYAKMVEKVGNKRYWEQWAKDVAKIAQNYIERIKRLIATDEDHKRNFDAFLDEMRGNLNPSVSADEVIQMLAQHLITQPVFEALFENYSFVQNNPVSQSMSKMISLLEENAMDKDTQILDRFYQSVRTRVEGIDNAVGKQKIIVELYEKFFKTAFKKVVEQLGIVYTPIEVVDFINNSVAHVLKKEFKRNLSDQNVRIIDPFTGTGTFITRLIQTGLINADALPYKYEHELWANEIVLLAYYIASINIENAYHDAVGLENGYKPFNGICLTDTFQMYEDMATTVKVDGQDISVNEALGTSLDQNSERIREQRNAKITVVIGNPPYSVGQKAANDFAQNQKYPKLEEQIANTYVKESNATLSRGLYDSYIKAFRWASDRIDKNGGIIAFVTNAGWIDGNAMDGFRKTLESEFSSVYIFNLRGAIRGKSGDAAKREGQNVFDIMTGVAITVLVKKPKQKSDKATIYYHDIGDYLSRTDKLETLTKLRDITNTKISWKVLKPNEHGDWLNQRSDLFSSFINIGNCNLKERIFELSSNGVSTSRDAWCYNFSSKTVADNISRAIVFYNSQVDGYQNEILQRPNMKVEEYIDTDPKKFSWDRAQRKDIPKNKKYTFINDAIVVGTYKPFVKEHIYFDRQMNNCVAKMPVLFPSPKHNNLLITLPNSGAVQDFSSFMVGTLMNYGTYGGTHCFPLYYYEKLDGNVGTLFDTGNVQYAKRDGITDFILEQCHKAYGNRVTKEDIFYYVYGILHSPDYRTQFAADLKKMLPRIPLVEKPADFWAFSKAGRDLANLHLNYEDVDPHPDVVVTGAETGNFHVEKMKFITKGDKTAIQYNPYIKVTNIPLRAYDYIVNGKSAIDWIMERYAVTVDKASQIKNDPNDWATEHNRPRYILDLLLSVINVSIQTMDIVDSLPRLEFK